MSVQKNVLDYLLKNSDSPISGQALASLFNVSRNAIWKAIEQLRQQGYQIESKRNQGYQLKAVSDELDTQQISLTLSDVWSDLYIEVHKEVSSTNDLAKQFSIDFPGKSGLFISEKQTQGRGRRGRAFHSVLSNGLYFSLALKPNVKEAKDVPRYTIAAATALVQSIEEATGLSAQIKWVNDVFYKQRKIAGILSEAISDLELGGFSAVIIGIGINLSGDFTAASSEVQDVAGTLFENIIPDSFNRNTFLSNFLNHLGNYHLDLTAPTFIEIYRQHLMGLNKEVSYSINNEQHSGIIEGIDQDGHLLVRQRNGSIEILLGQEVHFSSKQFAK